MSKRRDLTGLRFGRWVVLEPDISTIGTRHTKNKWVCLCDCGETRSVQTCNLTMQKSRSCGCLQKDWVSWNRPAKRTHGKSRTPAWGMYRGAMYRAKRKGLEFDIKVTDIEVPTHCPLLGIVLICGKDSVALDSSPTLDRIHNDRGYTKDNVWVVSRRANTIKSTASIAELELIVKNLKEKIQNG